MRKPKSPPSASHRSHVVGEDDHEFRDLIDSIAVTKEELAAIASLPDYSVREVKEYLRKTKRADRSKANVPAALRTFQRRFARGWREIAKEFVTSAIVLDHQAPNPRKS